MWNNNKRRPFEVEIVPQRQSRAWWNMNDAGELVCSLCGGSANPAELTTCPGCGSNMAIDETWTKRILERGYHRQRNTSEG